jgi:hypothetical protein
VALEPFPIGGNEVSRLRRLGGRSAAPPSRSQGQQQRRRRTRTRQPRVNVRLFAEREAFEIVGRTFRSSCATSSGNGGSGGSGAWSSPPAAAVVCAHYFPSPNLSVDPELVFELIVFAYSIVAMALQLLHLYRSVFWLPHSYNDNAVVK